MWIHKQINWTQFSWDTQSISYLCGDIRRDQGHLMGYVSALGFDASQEASLITMTEEIVKSSAIEGEKLASEDVRSSIARNLGLDIGGAPISDRSIESIVIMMLDATVNHAQPLTEQRLHSWHSLLFPTGRSGMSEIGVGKWRDPRKDPMQVISGAFGRETIHFEAPDAALVPSLMNEFINWVNDEKEIDPVIKAAVAHIWFLTVHPYEDGNGRVARALSEMMLTRADGSAQRFYSMSSQIALEKENYYDAIEKQQRGSSEITAWMRWYLSCLDRSLRSSKKMISRTLFKAKYWRSVEAGGASLRQKDVLTRMLDPEFEGHINTSKYAKLVKCSQDTAHRDIQKLEEMGVLIKNESGGRSTSYRLPADENEMNKELAIEENKQPSMGN